ncbi:MAG: NAD(P)-dependent oxidoreductase [Gammaproteobacteria bacterium]|nr:NAD(P)-dependent oxidoreductase [Gammaproteobacteria bacterium]
MDKIGFIGLGIMGLPMALNLKRAGYDIYACARKPERLQLLLAQGATACATPARVAESSDVIIIMVSDTPDVEQVVLGDDGVVAGARAGSVVVDMSTISPSVSRQIASRLEQAGVDMLDAPVSGGEKGAIEGTLSIMVGGNAAVLERTRPVFEVLGSKIVHIGDHGAGQVAKACNQLIIAQTVAAIGEAFMLAKANEVDPFRVREALLGGFAASRVLENHGQRMLTDNFGAGFKARLHQKDLRIALESAAELGIAIPGAAAAAKLLDEVARRGMGEEDSIAIYRLQQELNVKNSGPEKS